MLMTANKNQFEPECERGLKNPNDMLYYYIEYNILYRWLCVWRNKMISIPIQPLIAAAVAWNFSLAQEAHTQRGKSKLLRPRLIIE